MMVSKAFEVSGLALLDPVDGGASRQESARLGLESLADIAPATVLIHDAARPFVDAAAIERTLAGLRDRAAAVPAVPLSDTLKRSDGALVGATIARAVQDFIRTSDKHDYMISLSGVTRTL